MTTENPYQAPDSEVTVDTHTEESQLEYAGFWIRVGASIIDTLFILIVTTPLLFMIYGADYFESESVYMGVWDLLLSYVFPAIAVIVFWIYKSATPGKMILGLKVLNLNEGQQQLGVGQSILRYVGYYVSSIVLFLGFIWIAFDQRKQGWHDKMANTVVVKEQN